MRRILLSATALAALAAAAPAFATEGWYGRVDAGYSFDASGNQRRIELLNPPPFPPPVPPSGSGDGGGDDDEVGGAAIAAVPGLPGVPGGPGAPEIPLLSLDRFIPANDGDLDSNAVLSIAAGYAFVNSGFRLEGQVAYRYNDSRRVAFFDPDPFFVDPVAVVDGPKVHAWSYMANGYYDFNEGGWWQPYVGAGAGADQLVVSEEGMVANVVDLNTGHVVGVSDFRVDDNDWSFAWQAMAGVAFSVTEQLMIDVGYRYHQANDGSFRGIVFPSAAVAPVQFFSKDLDYNQSAITVGVVWQFLAVAAPPAPYTPPAPAPACLAEQYTAERGKDLAAAMDAAAAQSRTCNYSGVVISGPDSQMPTVRDGLVQRGVPASMISTQPSGAATGPVTITLN